MKQDAEKAAWPKTLIDMQPRAVAAARSRQRVLTAPPDYPAGYFTALAMAPSKALPHGFPPKWRPSQHARPAPVSLLQTVARREADSTTGKGWGTGTQLMPGKTTQDRPAFMGKLPGVA